MESESQQYCLRWNNHRTNLLTVFSGLFENQMFTDVTLVVENGAMIKCHKIVLAACSSYFQNLFFALPCKHPVIVLKDVKDTEIRAILSYMYHGEVNIVQEHLGGLMKVAVALKVKGLIDENGDSRGTLHDYIHHEDRHMETSMSPPPAISTSTGGAIAHSSHDVSPSHSTEGAYGPYIKSAIDHEQNRFALSMWSGLRTSQQCSPHSSSSAARRTEYNNFDVVPVKHRKVLQPNLLMNRDNTAPILRTVLGQSHADSSLGVSMLPPPEELMSFRSNSNGSANDNENRRGSTDFTHGEVTYSSRTEAACMNEDDKSLLLHPRDSKSGIRDCVANPKEWKRYKQYTRQDILNALDEVQNGMSAVQAARKHGVPSRTLYDKVKKLGIKTNARSGKRSTTNGSSSACFPLGIGGNLNGRIYGRALCENEIENSGMECSTSGRGTAGYTKVKDISQDRDLTLDSMARCTPSPVIRCAKQQQENMEDQVEDLSVSRKSDVPVIVPSATSNAIKVEVQDNIAESDNSPVDCCDYK